MQALFSLSESGVFRGERVAGPIHRVVNLSNNGSDATLTILLRGRVPRVRCFFYSANGRLRRACSCLSGIGTHLKVGVGCLDPRGKFSR